MASLENADNTEMNEHQTSYEAIVSSGDCNIMQHDITECSLTIPSNLAQMSKRQLKKLKKKEFWLATKVERRHKEKEKARLKRKAKIEAGIDLGPSRKLLKSITMSSSNCKQRLVIDMSYDENMNERDQCKAVKQIHRCYSCNRRVENPLQFYVTSFNGPSLKIMHKNNGFQNWDVNLEEKSYLDLFPNEDIVYLSSESENVISSLDVSKVYIIGGLVDHNNHKGLCHRLAVENNIAHARLPIDEYLEMKTRKVLTIDHVFRIILAVASEGKSWKDAFLTIIPARKGAIEIKTNDLNVGDDHSNELKQCENDESDSNSSDFQQTSEILEKENIIDSMNHEADIKI